MGDLFAGCLLKLLQQMSVMLKLLGAEHLSHMVLSLSQVAHHRLKLHAQDLKQHLLLWVPRVV
jgi:hypothetical protein